jgi:hypothetical protein
MLKIMLLTVALSVAVSAQTDAKKTGDFVNGRFWEDSTPVLKVGYVFGLRDGLVLIATGENRTAAVQQALAGSMVLYRGGKATLEELIDQIDGFYADRANIRIPVFEAYAYCMKRTSGLTKRELDDLLTEMRRRAARF